MPKRGLPETVRMRHDSHYVEALTSSAGTPIGRMVPIEQIDANPNQPRQVMGDLTELMQSISEKGVIEPLVVRQRGDRYQIVAGPDFQHVTERPGRQAASQHRAIRVDRHEHDSRRRMPSQDRAGRHDPATSAIAHVRGPAPS